jgi:hypothetical protein
MRSINEIKVHIEHYGPKIEDVRELCALYEEQLAGCSKVVRDLMERRVNPPIVPMGYDEWSKRMG